MWKSKHVFCSSNLEWNSLKIPQALAICGQLLPIRAHNKSSETLQELRVMWSLDWLLIDNVIPLGHRSALKYNLLLRLALNENEKACSMKKLPHSWNLFWGIEWLSSWVDPVWLIRSIRFNRNLAFHSHNCGNLWRINLTLFFSSTKLCTPCVSRIMFFFISFHSRCMVSLWATANANDEFTCEKKTNALVKKNLNHFQTGVSEF